MRKILVISLLLCIISSFDINSVPILIQSSPMTFVSSGASAKTYSFVNSYPSTPSYGIMIKSFFSEVANNGQNLSYSIYQNKINQTSIEIAFVPDETSQLKSFTVENTIIISIGDPLQIIPIIRLDNQDNFSRPVNPKFRSTTINVRIFYSINSVLIKSNKAIVESLSLNIDGSPFLAHSDASAGLHGQHFIPNWNIIYMNTSTPMKGNASIYVIKQAQTNPSVVQFQTIINQSSNLNWLTVVPEVVPSSNQLTKILTGLQKLSYVNASEEGRTYFLNVSTTIAGTNQFKINPMFISYIADCFRNCKSCFDIGSANCTSCIDGRTLKNNECVCGLDMIDVLNSETGVSTCQCKQNFVLNGSTCEINCSLVDFATNGSLNKSECICIAGYNWNATSASCELDCNQIAYSLGSNGTESCLCKQKSSWNGSACVVDCSKVLKQNGVDGNGGCLCFVAYFWNRSTLHCDFNCSKIKYATKPTDTGLCQCHPNLYWAGYSCNVICLKSSHASGYGPTNTTCVCMTNYFWNQTSANCDLNCDLIQNATKSDVIGGCVCQSRYIWDGQRCALDCSAVNNSNGSNGDFSCLCQTNFTWNSATVNCDVNCSTVPYSTNSNGTGGCLCEPSYSWDGVACILNCSQVSNAKRLAASGLSCGCETGYFWHQANSSCLSNVNCSKINFTSSSIAISARKCSCMTKYKWNETTCRCEINCAAIAYASTSDEISACLCLTNSFWNDENLLCQVDCSEISNTNGAASLVKCKCKNSFQWDSEAMDCRFSCLLDPKSLTTNKTLTPLTCQCQVFYTWDIKTSSCKLNCQVVFGSNGTARNNDACYCKNPALSVWSPYYFKCIPRCSIIQNSDKTVYGSGTRCGCLANFSWDSKAYKCV